MNLIKSKVKTLKKIGIGMLSLVFLFVTMCPTYVAQTVAPTTVKVLPADKNGGDTDLTAISIGDTRTLVNYKDSQNNGACAGTISYSASGTDAILTLDGVDVTTDLGLVEVTSTSSSDLKIVLQGDNKITTTAAAFAFDNCNVTFSVAANASLTIVENSNDSIISTDSEGNIVFESAPGGGTVALTQTADAEAVYSIGEISLNSGNITITQFGKEDAVYANGDITIKDGSLNITQNTDNLALRGDSAFAMEHGAATITQTGDENAVGFDGAVAIEGGALDITQSGAGIALAGADTFTMTNGTATIQQTGNENAVDFTGVITIDGGTLNITQTSDNLALAGRDAFTMRDGEVSTHNSGSDGAGIDVDGKFIMSGGSINANSTNETSAVVPLLAHNDFSMSGGSINMTNKSTSSIYSSLQVDGSFDMTNGSVTINSANSCALLSSNSNLSGGTISLTSENASSQYFAFEVKKPFTMYGGSVKIKNAANKPCAQFGAAANLNGGLIETTTSGSEVPIFGKENITISGAKVKALGTGSSKFGIAAETGKAIRIEKGSEVEALGSQNGIDPSNLTLDDSVTWAAIAGQSADTAVKLPHTKAADVVEALADGGQNYVKLYDAPALEATSITFDKNVASKEHTEFTVGFSLNGSPNKIIVTSDGTELQNGTDYVVNSNAKGDRVSATFQVREYLNELAVGTHALKFKLSDGKEVGDFTLNVIDTTPAGTDNDVNINGEQNQNDDIQKIDDEAYKKEDFLKTGDETSKKDDLPKTGDETSIIPNVLLLTAGLFITIIELKRKSFANRL